MLGERNVMKQIKSLMVIMACATLFIQAPLNPKADNKALEYGRLARKLYKDIYQVFATFESNNDHQEMADKLKGLAESVKEQTATAEYNIGVIGSKPRAEFILKINKLAGAAKDRDIQESVQKSLKTILNASFYGGINSPAIQKSSGLEAIVALFPKINNRGKPVPPFPDGPIPPPPGKLPPHLSEKIYATDDIKHLISLKILTDKDNKQLNENADLPINNLKLQVNKIPDTFASDVNAFDHSSPNSYHALFKISKGIHDLYRKKDNVESFNGSIDRINNVIGNNDPGKTPDWNAIYIDRAVDQFINQNNIDFNAINNLNLKDNAGQNVYQGLNNEFLVEVTNNLQNLFAKIIPTAYKKAIYDNVRGNQGLAQGTISLKKVDKTAIGKIGVSVSEDADEGTFSYSEWDDGHVKLLYNLNEALRTKLHADNKLKVSDHIKYLIKQNILNKENLLEFINVTKAGGINVIEDPNNLEVVPKILPADASLEDIKNKFTTIAKGFVDLWRENERVNIGVNNLVDPSDSSKITALTINPPTVADNLSKEDLEDIGTIIPYLTQNKTSIEEDAISNYITQQKTKEDFDLDIFRDNVNEALDTLKNEIMSSYFDYIKDIIEKKDYSHSPAILLNEDIDLKNNNYGLPREMINDDDGTLKTSVLDEYLPGLEAFNQELQDFQLGEKKSSQHDDDKIKTVADAETAIEDIFNNIDAGILKDLNDSNIENPKKIIKEVLSGYFSDDHYEHISIIAEVSEKSNEINEILNALAKNDSSYNKHKLFFSVAMTSNDFSTFDPKKLSTYSSLEDAANNILDAFSANSKLTIEANQESEINKLKTDAIDEINNTKIFGTHTQTVTDKINSLKSK